MARSSADRYLETDFPNLSTRESDGRKSNGNVQVKSDKDTGNYTVKRKTDAGLTDIYSYDAPSNRFSIQDQDLYDSFFAGQDGNQQKVRLDSQIKGATVDAAKKEITDRSLAQFNDLSQIYDDMLNQDGYLGFQNTVDFGFGTTSEDFFASDFSTQPEDWTNTIDPNFLTYDNGINLYDDLDIKTLSGDSDPYKGRAIDFQKGSTFVYPETMPDIGYDFIRFTSFKYVPAGLQVSGRASAAERIFTDKITEIMLPMLPNISESNSVDWGGDKANAFQLLLGNAAMGAIEGIGNLSPEQVQVIDADFLVSSYAENFGLPISELQNNWDNLIPGWNLVLHAPRHNQHIFIAREPMRALSFRSMEEVLTVYVANIVTRKFKALDTSD